MDFSRESKLRTLALTCAPTLSRIITQPGLYKKIWLLEVYYNFLTGKGSGAWWDMDNEIAAAIGVIYRPAPTILDLGGQLGIWSQKFLARAPNARIVMCEPNPSAQEAIRKLNLPNTELIPRAVGDKPGTATLLSSQDADGSASLHEHRDSFFSTRSYEKFEVQVDTVDRIVKERGLEFIDFMKMDIEGHELFALRGASQCLAERRIGGLLFEFGFCNLNSRTYFKDFWDLLSKDYFFYRITPSGTPLRIEEYYEDLEYFRGATNYVAELKDHPYRKSAVGR